MNQPGTVQRRGRGVLLFIGISLLAHLQLVLVLVVAATLNPEGCGEETRQPPAAFEVALVPDSEALSRARLRGLQRSLREQEGREEREARLVEGQVVELPRPRDEQRPERAKYLSEYDSKVAKETRAAPRPPGAARRPSAAASERSAAPRAAQGARSGRPAPRSPRAPRLAMRSAAQPTPPQARAPALSPLQGSGVAPAPPAAASREGPLAVTPAAAATAAPGQPRAPADRAADQGAAATGGLGRLMVSDQEMSRALGGGANDALSDLEQGEETLLNSRRWRYAGFFNRVKQQVAQNWHPDRVYRRRDPTGNVYGFKDRLTVLIVTLDPQGGLRDLKLEQPSGLAFLDEEAMSAFRLAQPFPNPPRGLVDDKSGQISFRFGFLFELTRQPSFRVLRYNGG
ncbi:MAG: TonB family protein [Proteobacteria bacterium]|nr:TonB family protein [Pseudomonadota bacterium]